MSGRPTYPTWTIPGFSTDANYPAGANPWNGQPTKVAYPGMTGGFVPNQPNAAQYFNYLHNIGFVTDQATQAYLTALLDYLGQSPALDWKFEQLTPAVTPTTSAVSWASYDAVSKRWIVIAGLTTGAPGTSGSTGSGNQTGWYSHNGGSYWLPIGTVVSGAGYFGLLASNPNTGLTVAIDNIWSSVYTLAAEAFTWTAVFPGFTVATNTTYFGAINWVPFLASGAGGFLVGSCGNGSATRLVSGNATGSTWTDLSGSLPSTFTSVNAVHWYAATSATRWCAFTQETNANYCTTDDGVTYTARTLSGLGANEHVLGLHYSATMNLWMLVVGNTTTNAFTKTYTSPDAVTWTLASTMTSLMLPQCLGGSGALWVMKVLKNPAASEPVKRCKILLSVDSGVTWRETDGQPATSGVNHIASDGQRFMTTDYVGTVRGTFSAGLPPAVT